MDPSQIIDGLIFYLELVVLLTFHEMAHAWVAWKCGDDTARLQGRLSLNPIVHIDLIGTVLLPLLMIFGPSGMGHFLVGYAKPVPVNLANLRNPIRDDILIALAGPAMNLLLAFILVGLARVGFAINSEQVTDLFIQMAQLSLVLCFFNLIPVPPLDGSHVLRGLVGMSWETYMQLCRFGIFAVIIVLNIPGVRTVLGYVVDGTMEIFARMYFFPH